MYTKICVICGKTFEAKYKNTNMCSDDHYRECSICGNLFLIDRNNRTSRTCSKKCTDEQRKRTCRIKYGGDAPMSSQVTKDKATATSLERYGTCSPNQSEEVKSKMRVTMQRRYGVDYTWQSKELTKKFESTMKDRYGVSRPTSMSDFCEKTKATNQEKYSVDWATQSDTVKDKTKSTNQERYGVDCVFQSEDIKSQIKDTIVEKYGVDHVMKNPEVSKKVAHSRQMSYAATISDESKRQNYLDFIENPVSYIESRFEKRPTAIEVSDSIGGFDIATMYSKLQPFEGARLLSRVRSHMEDEVEEFLCSIIPSDIVLKDDRQLIAPKEVDLYIPDHSLAIECNPSYTHNSSINSFNCLEILPPSYHRKKSFLCEEKGVFLFHLFGYEWLNNKDIMKSILANLLGVTQQKYYARKLFIKEVPSQEAELFLIENHRQGATSSKIRLGLYDNQELVSLMTFGKMRGTQGRKLSDSDNTWELSRFCSKINCSVVGGASKLFKYFVRNYSPDKVVSFSDVARSKGTLYQTLGFKQISQSDPSYVWSTLDDTLYYNRVSCQKSNLKHLLHDDKIDLSMTERQIMIEHGFVQVYDCGVIRWEWHK